MDTVRIGIIGCGGIARDHASDITGIRGKETPPAKPRRSRQQRMIRLGVDVYQKIQGRGTEPEGPAEGPPPIGGAQLVAAADIDANRVNDFRATFGIPKVYTDYHELLANDEVDAVFICTPPNLHATITAEAAARGKHVFCEKPMALTAAECTRMIEATRDAGVLLQIGYVLRFSSDVKTIRDSVQRGDIGRPVLWRQIMNMQAGADQRWVHDFKVGRGVLWEDSHYMDFLVHVLGEPASVYAVGGRFKPEKTTAPDAFAATITFKSGDKALFTHSYSLPGFGLGKTSLRKNWAQIDIIGPGGYIQFPDRNMADVLTIIQYSPEGQKSSTFNWESDWGANGYRDELKSFVESVRQGKPSGCPGEESRKTIILLEGVLQSMNTGEAVHFA